MSGRGHRRNLRQGHEGGGRPSSFFDERCSIFGECHRRETLSVNLPLVLFLNEEGQSDDVFREIEDYFEEAEKGKPV